MIDRGISFRLEGRTPLLMNCDGQAASGEWLDDVQGHPGFRRDDDRTPPWRWMGRLYHDGSSVVMPAAAIVAALAEVAVPTLGCALTSAVARIRGDHCRLLIAGRRLPLADLDELRGLTFAEQAAAVRELGFRLSVKKAMRRGTSEVRVRPEFPAWEAIGTLAYDSSLVDRAGLVRAFERAGTWNGLLDWRPGLPGGGSHGRFGVDLGQPIELQPIHENEGGLERPRANSPTSMMMGC